MSQGSTSLQWSTVVDEAKLWLQTRGPAWAASVAVHAVIFAGVVATMDMVVRPHKDEAPAFEAEMETLAARSRDRTFRFGRCRPSNRPN